MLLFMQIGRQLVLLANNNQVTKRTKICITITKLPDSYFDDSKWFYFFSYCVAHKNKFHIKFGKDAFSPGSHCKIDNVFVRFMKEMITQDNTYYQDIINMIRNDGKPHDIFETLFTNFKNNDTIITQLDNQNEKDKHFQAVYLQLKKIMKTKKVKLNCL